MALASTVVVSHFTKLSFGLAAVNLFFVLSGYWIYRMYENKYMASGRPVFLFLASRFIRVLPIFWLFNGLALGMHYAFHDSVVFARSFADAFSNLFILGYSSLPQKPLVPAWSLDIEVQFYLLFPVLHLAFKTVGKYAAVLVAGALVAGGVCSHAIQGTPSTVFPFLGFFMLGGLVARSHWQPSKSLVMTGAASSLLILAGVLLIPGLRGFAIHDLDTQKFSWNTALNFGIALCLAPLVLFSVHNKSAKVDRLLGDTSYVLYCSHWIAVLLAAHYFAGLTHMTKTPAVLALLLSVYGTSFFLTLYVDRPIGHWRELWVSRAVQRDRREHLGRCGAHPDGDLLRAGVDCPPKSGH
jgi:peptidoglycan/LPS O-acetylase OafA/YrhL